MYKFIFAHGYHNISVNLNLLRHLVKSLILKVDVLNYTYIFFLFKGPDYDEMNEKERLMECTRMRQLLLEWERAKQKRFPFQNQTNQVVQTGAAAASASASAGAISAQPRKHLFSMPHLNGDVNKKFSYQVYTIRHQMQYDTSQNTQQNQFMLSNSVVLYDQARGQYYTELA